ncbi:MAG: nucleoside-diphosphate kinase [Desulfobacteraceae bacterium]|nr:nucleoside-diphosphate kinase [Desulfobacteraceae bacterium]
MQQTFAIVKPDGVARGLIGDVLKRIESAGLRFKAMKLVHMTKAQAEGFYAVHKARPFFKSLTEFMSSGPALVMILEGENAMQRNRDIMGATNPENAEPGTIRKELAESIEANTVHGSDSEENAAIEIAFFFSPEEIVG